MVIITKEVFVHHFLLAFRHGPGVSPDQFKSSTIFIYNHIAGLQFKKRKFQPNFTQF